MSASWLASLAVMANGFRFAVLMTIQYEACFSFFSFSFFFWFLQTAQKSTLEIAEKSRTMVLQCQVYTKSLQWEHAED